jgi:hypothetical protein
MFSKTWRSFVLLRGGAIGYVVVVGGYVGVGDGIVVVGGYVGVGDGIVVVGG